MPKAIESYLKNQHKTAKRILIQVLFAYPDYPKAVLFLNVAYQMPPGSYKVKDQIAMLMSNSNNYFYGGNYMKAAEDLEVASILDRSNPSVYEKLGSAYYMMNQKQKAIDSWTTSLFLSQITSR